MVASSIVGVATCSSAAPVIQPAAALTVLGPQTCLIINGGIGGTVTKARECAQIQVPARGSGVAYGSYVSPSSLASVTMTTTLQANVNPATPAVFVLLATKTANGLGTVSTTTAPVHVLIQWSLRSCVAAGIAGNNMLVPVCTGVN